MADSYQHSTESRFAQAALNFVAMEEFPVELVCPITQTLLQDPVLTVQGNVYERAAITECFKCTAQVGTLPSTILL